MTVGFALLSGAVIITNPQATAEAFGKIFEEALNFRCGAAGVSGFLLSGGLRYGTMRGILSNEAGCGTAPAAHAVSGCKIPAKQGIWGIFEVFVDTVVLCTMTALVIIIGGGRDNGGDYMMMTLDSYRAVLGDWAGYFLAVAVVLFGLATVLCWAHYGMECVGYFSQKKTALNIFAVLYSASAVTGAVVSALSVWECADLSIGVMTSINLCALLLMSKQVKKETEEYFKS